MKRNLLLLWILLIAASFAPVPDWNADVAKAQIKFSVAGPLGKVKGSLSGLKATIVFDENNLAASSVSASVEAKTIQTGIALRNKDLRENKKWLDTNKYPLISFRSKQIQKTAAGYKATGDLTLKATTRTIEIPFTFTATGNNAIIKGAFIINRQDYGVGKSSVVGKEISIAIEVPVTK